MNPTATVSDDLTRHIEALGYFVTWDYDRDLGLRWYDIFDGDELVAQIEPVGVALADVVEQCRFWVEEGPTGDPDRIGPDDVAAPGEFLMRGHGERFDALIAAIAKEGG